MAFTPTAGWSTLILIFLLGSTLKAQAVIDPKLPAGSEPLTRRRIVFVLADYGSVLSKDRVAPLSSKQKFEMFAGETFDPGILASAAALAAFSQAFDLAPEYGQGWKPYAQRTGALTANLATSTFFSEALFPTVFHQDPRYFKKGVGSVRSRFWYAVSQTFITQTDHGRSAFNYSQMGSIAATTAMTSLYYPDRNTTYAQLTSRAAIGVATSALINILREFAPERFVHH